MTVPTADQRISSFDVPALPPLSAVRDRSVEAAERTNRLREDGYVQGYQEGLDAAAREIEREIADHRSAANRLVAAASALEAATHALGNRDALTLAEVESQMIAVGVDLATQILGYELRATDQPVLDALRRAVELIPDRGTPVVRVHPDDLATVAEAIQAGLFGWEGSTDVAPDPTVERGGCLVDVDDCRIDAQIGPAIERLRNVLRD